MLLKKLIIIIITTFILFNLFLCSENPVKPKEECEKPWEGFNNPVYFSYPSWHPDGEWIAVEHADSIDSDNDTTKDYFFIGIWIVHAESGEKKPLIESATDPAWSPDGKKIAVGNGAQIYTINVNTLDPVDVDLSTLTQITDEGRYFNPTWSFDQNWIGFEFIDCDGPETCGTWVYNSLAHEKKLIESYATLPSFALHSNLICYKRSIVEDNGNTLGDSLYIYSINNNVRKGIAALMDNNFLNLDFRFTPDDRKISFTSKKAGSYPWAVWTVDTTGANLQKISPDTAWTYDWHPNGKKLVYVKYSPVCPYPDSGELFVYDLETGKKRKLTNHGKLLD